ncbi:unnamed protein product [Caenorhabditis nigoni]|nr:hypothetical protein B9Z55_016251 [Caenorhabditis nigoni]
MVFPCSCLDANTRECTPTPPTETMIEDSINHESIKMYVMSTHTFPEDVQELLDVPAGRRVPDPADDHVLTKYNQQIKLIKVAANVLPELWDKITVNRKAGIPITSAVMMFRLAMDTLSRHYLDFFRESSFKVDNRVQERKDTAKLGFFALRNLRNAVDQLNNVQSLVECEEQIKLVIRMADELHGQICETYEVTSKD